MRPRCWLMVGMTVTLACGGGGDGGTGPGSADPGPVDLILATPMTDDGMLLVLVTGGAVSSVSGQGYEFTSSTPSASGVKILVRGSITDGPIVRIELPNRNTLGNYSATISQAAARVTYEQQNAAQYTVTLQPQ